MFYFLEVWFGYLWVGFWIWELFVVLGMAIHITPIGDLEPHEENTTCKCEPKVIYENGEMIVIHNSFDGREGVEITNEILNNIQ